MGIEIERKFLLVNESWREFACDGVDYRQGYLNRSDRCSVRARLGGGKAKLNIKSAEFGVSRSEFEYEIPVADARQILDGLCRSPLVEKTRYVVTHAGHDWEVDVFSGDNHGLVVAEIELAHIDEAFEKPQWAGEEVTHESRYYNVCLVEHPYKNW
jgi:adenylate cyclase